MSSVTFTQGGRARHRASGREAWVVWVDERLTTAAVRVRWIRKPHGEPKDIDYPTVAAALEVWDPIPRATTTGLDLRIDSTKYWTPTRNT